MTDEKSHRPGFDPDYPLVSGPTKEQLERRQLQDYREYKRGFCRWLATQGKDPQTVEGYSHAVQRHTTYKTDVFYRWLWDTTQTYTTSLTEDDADAFIQSRIESPDDLGNSIISQYQKVLKRVFNYRVHALGEHHDWEPVHSFTPQHNNPRDFLNKNERQAIREAALDYGSLPSYENATADERDKIKAHLAQRFEKPKEQVTVGDWKRANSWKFPSLIWTALDAGLRPIEVQRSNLGWLDTDNGVLRIPKDESSKNDENWVVSITTRTAKALDRWLAEREVYDLYDGRDEIWLTKYGNPYSSGSLNTIFTKLCEQAGIDGGSRDLTFYAIRASTATYMAQEAGLAAAQAQLRHTSPKTTMKYDQAPPEDRRDALDKMR